MAKEKLSIEDQKILQDMAEKYQLPIDKLGYLLTSNKEDNWDSNPNINNQWLQIAEIWTKEEIIAMLKTEWIVVTPEILEPILGLIYNSKDNELGGILVDFLLKDDVLNLCWLDQFNFANKIKYLPIQSMIKFIEWVRDKHINLLVYTQAAIVEMGAEYAKLMFTYFNKDAILRAMKNYNEQVAEVHGLSRYHSIS